MILDVGANCHSYKCLHPLFERAFLFLSKADLRGFAPGRHQIEGGPLVVSIEHTNGRGRDAARLEAHRRHIDIQYTMDGDEEFGWMPTGECGSPSGGFDETQDVGFFERRPASWLFVPTGTFVVFFPQDAHAPLAGRGALKKAIVKVPVEAL